MIPYTLVAMRGFGPGIVMVAAGTLCLGACTGSSGTAASGASPEVLSIQEYGTVLTGAVGPLDAALKELDKARGYKGLSGRVTAVEQAGEQAFGKLNPLRPPAENAPEHTQLLGSLGRFYSDVKGLGSQVDTRKLCTGAALRAKVGDASGTADLRAAMTAVRAKLTGAWPGLTLPSAGQKAGKAPANGTLIRSRERNGEGTLTINNGNDVDVVVTLRKDGKTSFSVYVREHKKHTVKGVNDGSYEIFYTAGSDWDGKARAFGRDCAFNRFGDLTKFTTTRTATQIRWSVWRITLNPVVGGNTRTTSVDPDDYPADS